MATISVVNDVCDAAALADLAAQTFHLACPPGSTAEDMEAFVSMNLAAENFKVYIADPKWTVLCVRGNADLIGYSMLVHDAEPAKPANESLRYLPTIELSKFYVLERRHGDGIAIELMVATLNSARTSGAQGIWLGVNDKNDRAIRFYSKCGFSQVGVRTFRLGRKTEHDFILERML